MALKFETLSGWLKETWWEQPEWRTSADIEADYHDGNQYDSETLEAMKDRGIPPVVVNIIQPTINFILGLEAKTRTDWKVAADDESEEAEQTALALSALLHKAERKSKADHACSEAYAGQIKTGLGWVEVARESNPYKHPHRVRPVNRREIWWDWQAEEDDMSDARYLIRRKWYDAEQLELYFPDKVDIIRGASTNGHFDTEFQLRSNAPHLFKDALVERDWTFEEQEWRNVETNRLCVFEVWYREWERQKMVNLPDGRTVKYDSKNPAHKLAKQTGRVREVVIPSVHVSFWVGPHQLVDMPSPYPHRHFPYVPFFGFREDRTGVPYGMIRSMKPMQDEINARRARMMWGLSASRVFVEDDAVQDHSLTQQEVNRRDAYVILNSNRRNQAQGIRVDEGLSLNQQQFQVYEDAKRSISEVSGVYEQMMGKAGGATSGRAIDSLVEQGSTTLGEINDNYMSARKMVGNLLLSLVIEDMGEQQTPVVVNKGVGGTEREEVVLNMPVRDETGYEYRRHDVARTRAMVELEDVPSTSTFRRQQFVQLTEVVKSLPEGLQAPLAEMVIMATDLPNRQQMAEALRAVTGGAQQPSPEQLAIEEQNAQLTIRELAAKVRKLEAEAMKTRVETQNLQTEAAVRDRVASEFIKADMALSDK